MNSTMSPQIRELKSLYDSMLYLVPRDSEIKLNFVPGMGPLNPILMVVGEAPGRMENAKVMPFQGRAGVALRHSLVSIGVDPEECFITNVVKYWPRDRDGKTRTPLADEILLFSNKLREEINIVNPDLVALCGLSAIRSILPEINSIFTNNGKLFYNKYVCLYHPAYALYQPHQKTEVNKGFKSLQGHILNIRKTA